MTTKEVERKLKEETLKEWAENSRFTLLNTGNKATTLEIVPETYSNIARFLNSANLGNGNKREVRYKTI